MKKLQATEIKVRNRKRSFLVEREKLARGVTEVDVCADLGRLVTHVFCGSGLAGHKSLERSQKALRLLGACMIEKPFCLLS